MMEVDISTAIVCTVMGVLGGVAIGLQIARMMDEIVKD